MFNFLLAEGEELAVACEGRGVPAVLAILGGGEREMVRRPALKALARLASESHSALLEVGEQKKHKQLASTATLSFFFCFCVCLVVGFDLFLISFCFLAWFCCVLFRFRSVLKAFPPIRVVFVLA